MIEKEIAASKPEENRSDAQKVDFAELISQISTKLDSGQKIDWEQLVTEYPHFAKDLNEIRPAMDALRNLNLAQLSADKTLMAMTKVSGERALGDFRIVREIGRGGMGVVYEAAQISIDRRVALKLLPLAELIDERALARFKNEVTAIATLDHPHIVSVYAIGEQRGVHYYAMQLIHGQSLAVVIRELRARSSNNESITGKMIDQVVSQVQTDSNDAVGKLAEPSHRSKWDELDETAEETRARAGTGTSKVTDRNYFRNIARLIIDVAEALDHAHECGIVHRDIKPDNLLLNKKGKLYITDFGLARIEAGAGVTMTGDVIGTLRYMSPEQVLAGRAIVDHRTDIYSLGATLYELLTLQSIWSGHDRADLITKISFEEPIRPQKVNPAIPTDLETVILKSINKNPNDRYASAKELADDLQRFLDDKPVVAKRPTLIQHVGKWTKRNPTIMWGAVIVLVILGAMSGVATALITEQRDEALIQKAKAEQRTEFARQVVTEMYMNVAKEWLDDDAELTELQEVYLKKAIAFFSDLADEVPDDAKTLIGLGDSLNAMGMMQNKLYSNTAALDSLERAIDTYIQALQTQDSPKGQAGLITAMANLTHVLLSQGKFAECEQRVTEFLTVHHSGSLKGLKTDPKSYRNYQNQVSRLYLNRAQSRRPTGSPDSLKDLEQAVSISRLLVKEAKNDVEFRNQLARSLGFLSRHSKSLHQFEEALRQVNEAIEHSEEAIRANPKSRIARCYLRDQFRIKSVLYMANGLDDYESAVSASQQYRSLAHELANEFGTYMDRYSLLVAYYHSASIKGRAKLYDQAELDCRSAIEAARAMKDDFPNETRHLHLQVLAKASLNLSTWLRLPNASDDQRQEAIELTKSAITEMKSFAYISEEPDDLDILAEGLNSYRLQLDEQDPKRMELGQEIVDIRRDLVEDFPFKANYQVGLGGSLHNLAIEHDTAGQYQTAFDLFEEAIAIQTRVLSEAPAHRLANKYLRIHYTQLIKRHLHCPQSDLRNASRIVELAGDALERWNSSWLWEGMKATTKRPFEINEQLARGIAQYASCLDEGDPLRVDLRVEVVDLQKKNVRTLPDTIYHQIRLGGDLNNLARDLFTHDRCLEAVDLLEEAIAIQTEVLAKKPAEKDAKISTKFLTNHYQKILVHYLFCKQIEIRNPHRAVEFASSATALCDEPWAWEFLAIGNYMCGDFQQSVASLEAILDQDPKRPLACFIHSAALAKLGKTKDAQHWFDEGQRHQPLADERDDQSRLELEFQEVASRLLTELSD